MKNSKAKVIIAILLLAAMTVTMVACGDGSPIPYEGAKGAPYSGLYEMDRMNNSCSYSYSKGVNKFTINMKWKTEDENVDYAEYTDEYFLEWSMEDMGIYELCKPVNDMSALKNNKHSIKPGEDNEIKPDVDSYFDGLPMGYYRFVKVFNVHYKDGTTEQRVACFDFDLSGN